MKRSYITSMTFAFPSPLIPFVQCFHSSPINKNTLNFATSNHHDTTSSALHASGFGFGANTKKSKKKKITNFKPKKQEHKSEEPILDRFGLPPPTEKDIFPDLDDDVRNTIIPVEKNKVYSHEDIENALNDYLQLNKSLFLNDDMTVRMLHQSPPVFTVDNFFTKSECIEYQNYIQNPNPTYTCQVTSPTFSQNNPYTTISKRTSTTWFCSYSYVPLFLSKVKYIFPTISLNQMEEPQLVLYKEGQEFSWHYDDIPTNQCANGGQRLVTILVYLNDLDEGSGGATIFRDLKDCNGEELQVRPKQGRALIFFPSFGDGTPDERTLHKGEILRGGSSKMICQMWLHQFGYKASVPTSANCIDDHVLRLVEDCHKQRR